MMAKRSSSRSGSPQSFIIFVLLCIIAVQSYFLFRQYIPQHGVHKKIVLPKKIISLAPQTPPEATAPLAPILPTGKSLGKIAIIVDDSGYSSRDCAYLKVIQYPVTVSILPNLAHSAEVAACAYKYNKGVMLHLPLEPHQNDEKYPENYIIKTSMSPTMAIKQFRHDLNNVPHVRGINNHMGSKATENRRLMAIIFNEMNANDLFFIDSRVTTKSICRALAQEKGIPFGERDIFLDNKNQREYIEGQFQALREKAQKQGYAIAIGHARPLSWQIIKEQTENLTREGFELVTAESLTQTLSK